MKMKLNLKMKKYKSSSYRIGNLSVSVIVDELIFFYRGKEKVYLKKIKIKRLFSPVNKVIFASLPIILTFFILIPGNNKKNENSKVDDEAIKNQLLLSKETDFSEPEETVELKIIEHKVKKGETLSLLAKKYGVSMDTICGCSGLTSYDLLSVGTVLKIPNKDGILYKLTKGQKIVSVAQRYKVSVEKIIAENNFKNPDFLPTNKYLFIPDAKPQNIFQGFLWPTRARSVTSGYGWRRHPINRHRHFHQGIDVKASYEWIRAAKFGKITYTGWMGGYGKAIIIAHPNGWKSLYGHLSRISVRRGQYVKQGQYIGKSGNTGYSTGAHLHFELMKNGRNKNPYKYLKK